MRTPDQIVQAEVCACASSLIATLTAGFTDTAIYGAHGQPRAHEARVALAGLCEQAMELAAPVDDWEEAAVQAGYEHGGDFDGFWFTTADYDGWKDAVSNGVTYTTPQEACDSEGINPYQREVFEHWIVTDWLADKLIEQGEKVDKDFAGLCIWARTTTGQMISADGVIERISAKLNEVA